MNTSIFNGRISTSVSVFLIIVSLSSAVPLYRKEDGLLAAAGMQEAADSTGVECTSTLECIWNANKSEYVCILSPIFSFPYTSYSIPIVVLSSVLYFHSHTCIIPYLLCTMPSFSYIVHVHVYILDSDLILPFPYCIASFPYY